MAADIDQLQAMLAGAEAPLPMSGDPSLSPVGAPADLGSLSGLPPELGAGPSMPAPALGGPQFASTDPMMVAQVAQDAILQMMSQDHMMLESQQQQAQMAAQPLIDELMMQAAQPMPAGPMGAPPMDPMMGMAPGAMPPMVPDVPTGPLG